MDPNLPSFGALTLRPKRARSPKSNNGEGEKTAKKVLGDFGPIPASGPGNDREGGSTAKVLGGFGAIPFHTRPLPACGERDDKDTTEKSNQAERWEYAEPSGEKVRLIKYNKPMCSCRLSKI